jgi:peroxiredoxin
MTTMTFRQFGLAAAVLLGLAFLVGFLNSGEDSAPASRSFTGDPAPPLSIKEWVKGVPVDVTAHAGERVCIIEFWATWCAQCVTSFKHLSDLQRKHADEGLVVVGVTTEEPEVVKSFVQEAGDTMDYTVAIDNGRATYDAYMKAHRMEGYPAAFLVDRNGRIVWKGHPMAGLENALKKALL